MTDNAVPLAASPLPEFLRRLAGPQPTPGGGSVAALAGALAAALVQMVGGLTAGKKGLEEVSETMVTLQSQADEIAKTLTCAIDEDAAAYDGVMAAFGLPKADDDQKAQRSAAIQSAMKQAAEVPFGVAQRCLDAARLAAIALEQGNPNASSDAAVALLLAVCGLEGALLNVAINLDSIKDADYVTTKKEAMERLFTQARDLRDQMWSRAHERIGSLPDPV